MKRMLVLIPLLTVSLVASNVLLAQDSPFFGVWKLDLAKSKYSGEQAPQSATRTVIEQGSGEMVSVKAIRADGSAVGYSYPSNFDGKDEPISGTPPFGADTIVVKIVDANTHTAIEKKAGKTLVTSRAVVSKDGKVLTISAKGVNAQGQPVNTTTVWDKE
jgi:hypothetical protein